MGCGAARVVDVAEVDVDMTDTVASVSDHSTTPQAVRAHGAGSGGRSNVRADYTPLLLADTPTGIGHTCAAMTPPTASDHQWPAACGAARVNDQAPPTSPPT